MSKSLDWKLILALVLVAVVWGTTYLGIKVAVETIPAWFVAGLRQGIAAFILFFILLFKKQLAWIGWKRLQQQLMLATLMIIVANGMTTVAEQHISSGLTSLLNALNPIIVFLASVVFGLQKASWKSFIGVIVGFSGIAFIFRDGFADLLDPGYRMGMLLIAIALSGWAAGTIYSKIYIKASTTIFLDLFYQFSFAAIVQLLLAFCLSSNLSAAEWSLESVAAVVYLAVFGSVIGYFSYHYALKKVHATEVALLSYFNTIIALFLGWLILDEIITVDLLIATCLIIAGVFITTYKRRSSEQA